MRFRSILVQLDINGPAEPRIRFAKNLAERYDAHLIGFAAGNVIPLVSGVDGATVDTTIYQEQVRDIEQLIKKVRQEFEHATRESGNASWRGAVGNPAHLLAIHARAADLIITGNPTASSAGAYGYMDIGDLVLNTGRPVMLAPDDHTLLKAERIVVAWKDAREARRAIADAMPFLIEASEVHLVTLGDEEDSSPEAESLADVANYLERHVSRISTHLVDTGSDVQGEAIARIAEEKGADLVIAGAYGHSRIREWIFGGMTYSLLRAGSVTRLFSY
jgi:nucleotide-binding universal stress UspA family protein